MVTNTAPNGATLCFENMHQDGAWIGGLRRCGKRGDGVEGRWERRGEGGMKAVVNRCWLARIVGGEEECRAGLPQSHSPNQDIHHWSRLASIFTIRLPIHHCSQCHQPGNYFMILSKNITFKQFVILYDHLILQLLLVGDPWIPQESVKRLRDNVWPISKWSIWSGSPLWDRGPRGEQLPIY